MSSSLLPLRIAALQRREARLWAAFKATQAEYLARHAELPPIPRHPDPEQEACQRGYLVDPFHAERTRLWAEYGSRIDRLWFMARACERRRLALEREVARAA